MRDIAYAAIYNACMLFTRSGSMPCNTMFEIGGKPAVIGTGGTLHVSGLHLADHGSSDRVQRASRNSKRELDSNRIEPDVEPR